MTACGKQPQQFSEVQSHYYYDGISINSIIPRQVLYWVPGMYCTVLPYNQKIASAFCMFDVKFVQRFVLHTDAATT